MNPSHTKMHRIASLTFDRENTNWGVAEGSKMLFSDQIRLNPYSLDRSMPVYRRAGDCYAQFNFRETERNGVG